MAVDKRGIPRTRFLAVAAIALLAVAAALPRDAQDRLAPENEREARANEAWPPAKILEIAGLGAGMAAAEIGAGRGRNVVFMADRIGPSGRVFAEDIDEDGLRHIADRCRRAGFENVETILGGLTDPKLPAAALDMIFIIGSYQHFSDAVSLMRNTRPALKAGGRMAVADYFSETDGPESVTEKTMLAQMEKAGFVLERIDKTLVANRLYVYLFRLPPAEGSPVLTGPYLGQTPPGTTPEIFAPGIVSTVNGAGCSGFLNDGKIFIFEYLPEGADWKFCPVLVMEEIDGRWTKPVPETFGGLYPYNFTIGPDGRTLYFSSLRSAGGGAPRQSADIWTIERIPKGWSQPLRLNAPVNTDGPDGYPTVSTDGTLYFMSVRPGGLGKDDIYRAPRSDGTYPIVENLGVPVNSAYAEVDVFVAPDESRLFFCSDRPGGRGKFDLYVSFRNTDGLWSEPVNLGERINTSGQEFRPSLSADGKYLFFTRYAEGGDKNGLAWVSAAAVDALGPKDTEK